MFTESEESEESEQRCFIYQLKQKHPKLSKTDLKHCLFIHMELSLKEIAELLNVSISTVKSGRHRAKTKINITDDRRFKEYLDTISQKYQNTIECKELEVLEKHPDEHQYINDNKTKSKNKIPT